MGVLVGVASSFGSMGPPSVLPEAPEDGGFKLADLVLGSMSASSRRVGLFLRLRATGLRGAAAIGEIVSRELF